MCAKISHLLSAMHYGGTCTKVQELICHIVVILFSLKNTYTSVLQPTYTCNKVATGWKVQSNLNQSRWLGFKSWATSPCCLQLSYSMLCSTPVWSQAWTKLKEFGNLIPGKCFFWMEIFEILRGYWSFRWIFLSAFLQKIVKICKKWTNLTFCTFVVVVLKI